MARIHISICVKLAIGGSAELHEQDSEVDVVGWRFTTWPSVVTMVDNSSLPVVITVETLSSSVVMMQSGICAVVEFC